MSNLVDLKKDIELFRDKFNFDIDQKNLFVNINEISALQTKNGKTYIELLKNSKLTAYLLVLCMEKDFVINKDFYLTPYQSTLKLTIKSSAYQKLILKNDIRKVIDLKMGVVFKGEKFQWDSINHRPLVHELNPNSAMTYEEIILGYAWCEFENGKTEGIVIRKPELDTLKNSSQMKDNNSVWNKYPRKMVEAKLYRELSNILGVNWDEDEKIAVQSGDNVYSDYIQDENIPLKAPNKVISQQKPVNVINDIKQELPEFITLEKGNTEEWTEWTS